MEREGGREGGRERDRNGRSEERLGITWREKSREREGQEETKKESVVGTERKT